jgi:hypothetical protein
MNHEKRIEIMEHAPHTDVERRINLQSDVAAWAKMHLPAEADSIAKLREEIEELASEPSDPHEIGDVLLGLMVHASIHGIDALSAAADKFEIVKTRRYAMQDNGTCRHVTENEGGNKS